MKILRLLIASGLVVLCLFGIQISSAYQPLLDFYKNSDLVLVGKIISLSQVPTTTNSTSQYPNQTRYDIQVEQYYKNPQQAKLVTVYGYAKGIYFSSDPTYDVGDRVFLYLHKENVYYQIQPHSLKLNNNCDARAMIPMATLPFEPLPISSAAGGHDFYLSDSKGNPAESFLKDNNVTINFNEQNGLPVVKSVTVELIVKTNNGTTTVMDDKKSMIVSACNGQIPMRWTFTPDIRGQYSAEINVTGVYDLGRESVLFSEPIVSTGFTVLENSGGPVIEKVPFISPLKQFKSGTISIYDVKCIQGFDRLIKTSDSSPACVKPETAQKLVERGWGSLLQAPISLPTIRENNGILSGDIVLVGGPSSLVGPKANYEVDVYATDGVTIVGKTLSDANAHYSIQLPAGNYIIYAPDYPTKQTHLVSVFSGKNTILNIVYGTGYK